MKPMTFTVCRDSGGWIVREHINFGPFHSKEQAVNLAEGMASAIRASGGQATATIDESDPAPDVSAA
jgi:hypothetical protein